MGPSDSAVRVSYVVLGATRSGTACHVQVDCATTGVEHSAVIQAIAARTSEVGGLEQPEAGLEEAIARGAARDAECMRFNFA